MRRPPISTLFPTMPLFRSAARALDPPAPHGGDRRDRRARRCDRRCGRSEEHTSELQSRPHLACRLFFETCGAHRYPPFSPPCRSSVLLLAHWTRRHRPAAIAAIAVLGAAIAGAADRKSTRLNSSHGHISHAAFFLKHAAPTDIHPFPHHAALPFCCSRTGPAGTARRRSPRSPCSALRSPVR